MTKAQELAEKIAVLSKDCDYAIRNESAYSRSAMEDEAIETKHRAILRDAIAALLAPHIKTPQEEAALNAVQKVREYCTNSIVAGSPFADEILRILDGREEQ